jgi:hypothetical protein
VAAGWLSFASAFRQRSQVVQDSRGLVRHGADIWRLLLSVGPRVPPPKKPNDFVGLLEGSDGKVEEARDLGFELPKKQ